MQVISMLARLCALGVLVTGCNRASSDPDITGEPTPAGVATITSVIIDTTVHTPRIQRPPIQLPRQSPYDTNVAGNPVTPPAAPAPAQTPLMSVPPPATPMNPTQEPAQSTASPTPNDPRTNDDTFTPPTDRRPGAASAQGQSVVDPWAGSGLARPPQSHQQ